MHVDARAHSCATALSCVCVCIWLFGKSCGGRAVRNLAYHICFIFFSSNFCQFDLSGCYIEKLYPGNVNGHVRYVYVLW